MRRVAVTGLGAITPVGNTASETWRAAVAGESGVDFIRAFDADGLPVRVAAEVKDFVPDGLVSPKELRRLDRNVLLALQAGKEAVADADLNGYDPTRVGNCPRAQQPPMALGRTCTTIFGNWAIATTPWKSTARC